MSRFTVVYDACVLYPAPLRDLLMRLCLTDLFKAHWTDQIHDEWCNALLRSGKFEQEKLQHVRELMDQHAADAKISGFEPLIDSLQLPDPNDRHVLAAAIHCNADAIVTFNRKDFPQDQLSPHQVEVIHPDDFVHYQIEMKPAVCCDVIRQQRLALKHPPIDVNHFLAVLQRQQLPQTVTLLRQYSQFL